MTKLLKCLMASLVFGALFFALSPGVLLTLPPTHLLFKEAEGACTHNGLWVQIAQRGGEGGCCATSYQAVAVHTVVFMLLVFICCWFGCDSMNM